MGATSMPLADLRLRRVADDNHRTSSSSSSDANQPTETQRQRRRESADLEDPDSAVLVTCMSNVEKNLTSSSGTMTGVPLPAELCGTYRRITTNSGYALATCMSMQQVCKEPVKFQALGGISSGSSIMPQKNLRHSGL